MEAHVGPMTAGRRVLLWRAVCREGPTIKHGRGRCFLEVIGRLISHHLAEALIQAAPKAGRKVSGWFFAITG